MKDVRNITDESKSFWDEEMEHFGATDYPNVSLLLRFVNNKKSELVDIIDKKPFIVDLSNILKDIKGDMVSPYPRARIPKEDSLNWLNGIIKGLTFDDRFSLSIEFPEADTTSSWFMINGNRAEKDNTFVVRFSHPGPEHSLTSGIRELRWLKYNQEVNLRRDCALDECQNYFIEKVSEGENLSTIKWCCRKHKSAGQKINQRNRT